MADQEMGGNSPQSTSEATPPQVDDSPEMVNQPSPSEEQRVSSSTDRQPPEVDDFPVEPSVSSTSDLEPYDHGRPSNQSQVRPYATSDTLLRQLLLSPIVPESDQQAPSPVQSALINVGLTSAAVAVPTAPAALESVQKISAASIDEGSSQEISKEVIEQNLEKSDDSNQQFDIDDLSSGSKSCPENIDSSPAGSDVQNENKALENSTVETAGLESNSFSRIGIVIKESSEIGSTETAELESRLSPSETGSGTQVTGSGTTKTSGLSESSSTTASSTQVALSGTKNAVELSESSSKTASNTQVALSGTENALGLSESSTTASSTEIAFSGTENSFGSSESSSTTASSTQVSGSGILETSGPKKEQSPSTSGSLTVDTVEKRRDTFSPKRKSPIKFQHLEPKRYSPCASDKRQSDSQMSTLLEDLDIKENNTKNTEPMSGQNQEISLEILETNESQDEESMEVQETDSRAEDETNPKCTKNDDEKMEESD